LIILLAVLPIIFFFITLYRLDSEKESFQLLFKLFLSGILACFMIGLVNLYLDPFPLLSQKYFLGPFFYHFFYVGFLEEILKWFCVYFIGYKNDEFDQNYDIILYADTVALGFALLENIFYVINGGYIVAILRAIFAIPAHLCYGTFMGYDLLQYKEKKKKKFLIFSIVFPMMIHGFYDFCLFYNSLVGTMIFIIFIVILFLYTTYILKEILKKD